MPLTGGKWMKKIAPGIVSILMTATAALGQQVGEAPKSAAPDAGGDRVSPLKAPGGLVVNVPTSGGAAAAGPAANTPCPVSPAVSLAVVIKSRVNLRGRANIAGGVVGEVGKDSVLVVEAEDGPGSPWYRVTDVRSGKAGWIHGDAIKVTYRR